MLFNDVDSAWSWTVKDVLKNGYDRASRVGGSRELVGYQVVIEPVHGGFRNVLTNSIRRASAEYGCAELLWYLSGKRCIELISAYAPQYERFAENGVAHGAYGYRWVNDGAFRANSTFSSQVRAVIEVLRRHHNSRQAVITCWNAGDLQHAYELNVKDVPCTLTLQFIRVGVRLQCVVNMRSQDLWLGFPYDVFCFTTLQTVIAHYVGLSVGRYTHNVGSMHVYDADVGRAEAAAQRGECFMANHDWETDYDGTSLEDYVEACVDTETTARRDRDVPELVPQGSNPLLDCVACCVNKWVPGAMAPYSRLLLGAMRRPNDADS